LPCLIGKDGGRVPFHPYRKKEAENWDCPFFSAVFSGGIFSVALSIPGVLPGSLIVQGTLLFGARTFLPDVTSERPQPPPFNTLLLYCSIVH